MSSSWIRSIFLPETKEGSYPPSVRIVLTLLMFGGLGMFVFPMVRPLGDYQWFWHRSYVMSVAGLVIAALCALLRQAQRTAAPNTDWLKPKELLLLAGLALVVVGADIHYSEKIGLLAFPPYYDGAEYMWEAKYALYQVGFAHDRVAAVRTLLLSNRCPMWKTLMAADFRLLGIGEWQSYAVRFWPILIILLTVYWIVRRRAEWQAASAAALFTALLPTIGPSFVSAALGEQTFPRGYLADVRPDLLCAAFVALAVASMIEHVNSFDEWTAILSGLSVGLAVLTKATAIPGIALASGIAAIYVVFTNRRLWQTILMQALWGFLIIALMLTPWLLSGGFEQTILYVRDLFTSQFSRYADAHATLLDQLGYYGYFLTRHMGWPTVTLALASPAFLYLAAKRTSTKDCIHQPLAYLIISAAMFVTVVRGGLKNDFFGLPSYLVLWAYCWAAFATWINSAPAVAEKASWVLSFGSITIFLVAGLAGIRNIATWKGEEFAEGRQDRLAFQQLALDLRRELTNKQSFVSIPAYGSPATILFYMPSCEGSFPQGWYVNGTSGPPVDDFLRQVVEPAKAVLVYGDGSKPRGWAEVGWFAAEDFPYYKAIAEWVRRPGSAHSLVKSYDLYPDSLGGKATIELYLRSD